MALIKGARMLDMMRMDLRIDSVRMVLDELGCAIRECGHRIDEAEKSGQEDYLDAVVDTETAIMEDLLGAAFVICQTYISSVVSSVKWVHRWASNCGVTLETTRSEKSHIMKFGSTTLAGTQYTQVQVIDAFANYFKHNDEWQMDWAQLTGNSRRTADIVMAAGASSGSTGNMRCGSESLGNPDYHRTRTFANILGQWRQNVWSAYENECHSNHLA